MPLGRTCKIGCGVVLLGIGAIMIIVGGALPRRLKSVFDSVVTDSIELKGSRRDSPPVRGTSYGGTAADEDDNGQFYDYYLADITNVNAVLTGAQPNINELGPFSYRRYTEADYSCGTCGVANGIQTWHSRPTRVYQAATSHSLFANGAAGGPLDTTYVTLPNVGYRALEATLKAMSGGQLSTFEQAGVPLFAAGGLRTLMDPNQLEMVLRIALMPVSLNAIYQQAAGLSSPSAVKSAFVGSTEVAPLWVNLTGMPPMATATVNVIFDGGNTASPFNPTGWTLASDALRELSMNNNQPGTAFTAFATSLGGAMAAADSSLYGASQAALQGHLSAVLTWLGNFLSNSPNNLYAMNAKMAAAGALYQAGAISENDWAHVLPAQLGSNSVMGFLINLNSAPNPTSRMGVSVQNSCPATVTTPGVIPGVALTDISSVAAMMPPNQILEFSCWNARTNTNALGTRLTSTMMKTLLGNFTSGPGFLPVPSPALAGTGALATFLTGAASLKADIGANVAAALAQIGPVSIAYGTYMASPTSANASAYATAVASAGACSANYDLMRTGLPCSAILDIAGWLNHIAYDIVWQPQFVRRAPTVFNPTSNTFGPHPDQYFANLGVSETNAMRAGPFIRCTIREALELGCHDNFLDYVGQLLNGKPPGSSASRVSAFGPSDYTNKNTEWAAYTAAVSPDSRYTGEGDIKKVDMIIKDQGSDAITTWGGPRNDNTVTVSSVGGSYSGGQFAPSLDLNVDYDNDAPKTVDVWVYQGRRTVKLTHDGVVDDPSGHLKLWRYALAPSGTNDDWDMAIPKMKSDTLATTPACSANVAALASGAPVYLSKPYFVGCASNALNGNPIPGYTYTDNRVRDQSRLGTYVDVEPITGLTLSAHKRLGAHLRWGPSMWTPTMVTTYGLVYWVDVHAHIDHKKAADLSDAMTSARVSIFRIVPGVLCGIGAFLFVAGLLLTFFGCRTPKSPFSTDPKNVPGQFDGDTVVVQAPSAPPAAAGSVV